MLVSQDMDKFDVEQKDGGNPSVDGSVGLNVRVAEHTFDITCVNFYNKVAGTNEMKVGSTEGTKKAVEF